MSMLIRIGSARLLFGALVGLVLWGAPSHALAGELYQDKRLGVSIRIPDKFTSIPLQPGEYYLLAKFKGPEEREYGKSMQIVYTSEMFVIRVPKDEKSTITVTLNGQEQEIEIPDRFRSKSVKEWIQKHYNGVEIKGEKDVEINKIKAKQIEFTAKGYYGDIGMRFVASVFPTEEVEYAVVGSVIASKFDKYGPAFKSAAKTFKLDSAKVEATIKSDKESRETKPEPGYAKSESLETNRRKKVEYVKQSIEALPAWYCLESEHYVYVSNTDKGLVNEVKLRLETLRRDVYEKLFPPKNPITAVSTVRVCKNDDEYRAYGGPGGSAGYWNRATEELVMYDDSKRNREYTFSVMNHEGFHQYIHYASGDIAPHSWFNEGTGDYFGGFKFRNGKFLPGKFEWRTEIIRSAARDGRAVPLAKFLYFEQRDYYANADICYAQGWALVYFLREHTDPKWRKIPEIYFQTLQEEYAKKPVEGEEGVVERRDGNMARKAAMDKAIEGIDVDALEKAFFKFCESI